MEVTKVDSQQVNVREKLEILLNDEAAEAQLCPVKDILGRFGDKWSIYSIMKLGCEEKLRFNELKALIPGISQRMLTVTLRSLEGDGLVKRTLYPEIPPRVEYELTELGQSLLVQLLHLAEWAKLNLQQIVEARERFAQKEQK